MKLTEKSSFLTGSNEILSDIYDLLARLPELQLKHLPIRQTALVIIDMVNGFAREGALKSPKVEELIPVISGISKACDDAAIIKLAFADCHTEASPEFEAYPAHCLKGTSESEVVEEIKGTGGYRLINKNSTNGFLEQGFREWLNENPIDTFLVTGDCTDICVQQFAITIKTWFNMQDKKSRVIVPIDAVDTYDLGIHNADLMNVMALYNMLINGIELVKGVR